MANSQRKHAAQIRRLSYGSVNLWIGSRRASDYIPNLRKIADLEDNTIFPQSLGDAEVRE